MGQGRRQTERITSKPGGVREAGSKQSGEGVKQSRQYTGRQTGKTARKCSRGKPDFALGECLCAAFMRVSE